MSSLTCFVLILLFVFVLACESEDFEALMTKPVMHFDPYDPSTDPMLIEMNNLFEFKNSLIEKIDQSIQTTETLETSINKEVQETQNLINLIKPTLSELQFKFKY
jgi:hypothetical protein